MSDDNTFESEKNWANVNSSRNKSVAWRKPPKENAEELDIGAKTAGARSPVEALSKSWSNLKSGVSGLFSDDKKKK